MNILELSEIQQLLFSIEDDTVEEICSIIARSDYFDNIDKQNILLSNISLLIELRPRQSQSIINLCFLLDKIDPSNSFSIQLFKHLLIKLSQEHQYFIYKGYYCNLFSLFLIFSSIEYLINSSQEKKAYSLARWFSTEIIQYDRSLVAKIFSFNFLKSVDIDLFKQKKHADFLLQINPLSKLPDELIMFNILRNDDLENLKLNIKVFSDLMLKKKHFFSIDSVYSQLTESSILLDESLSVFDICAYYNSINCFEYLCAHFESGNKSNFLQSIYQERIKSFNVLHFAIAGGSIPIILYLIDHKFPTDDAIQCAIYFHRNDLIDFFSDIDTEIPRNPMLLLTSSKDVWGTPLFQSCHTNNIEILLQLVNYKSLEASLHLPYSGPSLSSLPFPNPFFYNLNFYLYIYDNIIKSKKALESEDEKVKNECLFKFKNVDESEYSLSSLLSSVKFSKEILLNSLLYCCKKGYSEMMELMIKELLETSRLTEKVLSERDNHDHDEIFQFVFDLNSVDQNGNTLLILASKFNQISCVKTLLNIEQILHDLNDNGDETNFGDVNINAANNERRSAIEYACFNGNHEIVNLLLSTGRISIENLHKSLILCLRSYSYCNWKNFKDFIQGQNNGYRFISTYNIMYPYSYVYRNDRSNCLNNGRKINNKGELPFERIIKSIIETYRHSQKSGLLDSSSSNDILSSSEDNLADKNQPQICFSMYLKTIEKYSIENDNLIVFRSLMNCPETIKSLSKQRCTEIINEVIKYNSINILKYIFSSQENNDNRKLYRCPISIDRKENFLVKAISSNSFDVSKYLLDLGIFELSYDDVFKALRFPEIIRLIYEKKPTLIMSNINNQGKIHQTLLTQSAICKFVETFRFLHNLPSVDINAEGKEFDSINESFKNDCDDIFKMCMRHPTLDMNKKSFIDIKALEKVITIGDVISAKKILENKPKLDITEPYRRNDYFFDDPYYTTGYRYKKPDCLMSYAISINQNNIVDYFNHYLAINNKKPYNPNAQKETQKDTPQLKEIDLDIEESILNDDLESFKKLINKDNINMFFERNGVTPLNTAIQIGNVEFVKYLLSQPGIDVNLANEVRGYNKTIKYPRKTDYNIDSYQTYNKSGETPLIGAVKSKNKETVKLLLEMPSIDVNKESTDGSLTPLTQAIKMRGKKNYYAITKNGSQKAWSMTPMSEEEKAEDNANVQSIINMLIKFDGIDVNKCAKSSCPLADAAYDNQVETVKLMVDLFTDLPPDSKKTPLDLNNKVKYGKTAINNTKDEEIKRILRSKGAIEESTSNANKNSKPQSEPLRKQNSQNTANPLDLPSKILSSLAPENTITKFNFSGTTTSNTPNPFKKQTTETSNKTESTNSTNKTYSFSSFAGKNLSNKQDQTSSPTKSQGSAISGIFINVNNPFIKNKDENQTKSNSSSSKTNGCGYTNSNNTNNKLFTGFINTNNTNTNGYGFTNSNNTNTNQFTGFTNTNNTNTNTNGYGFTNSNNTNTNTNQFTGFSFLKSTTKSQTQTSSTDTQNKSNLQDGFKNPFDGNTGFAYQKKQPTFNFAEKHAQSVKGLEKQLNSSGPNTKTNACPSSEPQRNPWTLNINNNNNNNGKNNGWGFPQQQTIEKHEWSSLEKTTTSTHWKSNKDENKK